MGIVFSKEYEKENGTPTVLLLGNGFDLQLGLKSKYEDFLLYLFFLKTLHHLSVNKVVKHKDDYLKVLIDGENEYYGINESKDSKSNSQENKISDTTNSKRDDKKKFLSILEIAKERLPSFEDENDGKLGILENNALVSCIISILSQKTEPSNNKNVSPLHFGEQNPFRNLISTNWDFVDKREQQREPINFQSPQKEKSYKTVECCVSLLKTYLIQFLNQLEFKSSNIEHSKINGWMDVESIIECLLTKNEHLLTRFSYIYEQDNELSQKDVSTSIGYSLSSYCKLLNLKNDLENAYEMREALKQFTHEFCKFIQIQVDHVHEFCKFIQNQVDHVKEQQDPIESIKIELNNEIELYKSGQDATFIEKVDLFSNIRDVLNYNYSSLTELFHEYANITLHVNGKSLDETAIFGINEDSCTSQNVVQFYQEQQNKYCTYLFKQSQRVLKHVLGFNFDSLKSNKHQHYSQYTGNQGIYGFNLIIYGHSCSPADFDVIKTLLTHPNLRVAVVLCYNKEAMLSAYHNIRTMLGPQKIAEMMQVSSKMEKRLFFLERKES